MLTQPQYEAGEGTRDERAAFLVGHLKQKVAHYRPRIMSNVETPIRRGLIREVIWVWKFMVITIGALIGLVLLGRWLLP